ncbi:MAG: 50S ribosomal protein L11 methyltransferase [Lachnospiraceae bacterium]|nr:50S ribosomal protein L11 methyltransferase [Lachnospiraceae bacterium]
MEWTKLTIDTTVEAVDILSAFLNELGIEGIEICDHVPLTEEEKQEMYVDIPLIEGDNDGLAQISCYIDDSFDYDTLRADIACELTRLEAFIPVGSKKITIGKTEDKDWVNNWKQFFKPFRLYDNIVIKPTWETVSDLQDGDMVVEIDPGIAFGTGSHETTKLCIGQLKKYLKPGDKVFDVGCGSGILSIVSSMLGASFVHGTDIDEIAVRSSEENAKLNHLGSDKIKFSCGNLLEDNYIGKGTTFELDKNVIKESKLLVINEQYDIVVANILADVIIPLSAVVKPYMKPDGLFITSGIIADKEADVKKAMQENGLKVIDVVQMNDWVSVIAKQA